MKLFGDSSSDASPQPRRSLHLAWQVLAIACVIFTFAFLAFSLFTSLVLDQVEGVTKQIPQVLAGAVNQPGQSLPAGSQVLIDGEPVAVLESVVHTQTAEKNVGTMVTYRGKWTSPAENVPAPEQQLVGVVVSVTPTTIYLVSPDQIGPHDASSRVLLLSAPNRAYPVQTRVDDGAKQSQEKPD